LPRFRVYLEYSRAIFNADRLRLGVHSPVLWNVVTDDEHNGLVGYILHEVFLLGYMDQEAGTLAVFDLFFDVMGREHALQMTDGAIAKGVIMVAHNGGVGIGQDHAGPVNSDLQAGHLVLNLARWRG